MLDRFSFCLTALVLAACSHADTDFPENGAAPSALTGARSFVDARWYFAAPEHIDAWYAVTRALEQNFDDVCGDTFCEGEFSNYRSLGFRCSVEESSGFIGSCAWMLAASADEVVPHNGQIRVQWGSWRCKIPLARRTRVHELLAVLGAAEPQPISASLPGTGASIYDALVACL